MKAPIPSSRSARCRASRALLSPAGRTPRILSALVVALAGSLALPEMSSLSARNSIEPAERTRIVRESRAGYTDANTYYDRGIVRFQRLRKERSGEEEEPRYETVEEQNTVFETSYRTGGDLRLLTASFGDGQPYFSSLLRKSGSVSYRSSGEGNFWQRTARDFATRVHRAFYQHGIYGNEIPLLLSVSSSRRPSMMYPASPMAEEVTFNGVSAYRISGVRSSIYISVWIERRTGLIIAAKRARLQGSNGLLVATTLYTPQRNRALPDSYFSNIGAEDLVYDPGEWTFPPLNAGELMEKIRRLIPATSETASVPSTAADPPEMRRTPPPAETEPVPGPGKPPSTEVAEEDAEPDAADPERKITARHRNSIVIIEGDNGTGTGFVMELRGNLFVVTNLHVLSGNHTFSVRTVSGERIVPTEMFGAVDHDVAILRLHENSRPANHLVFQSNLQDTVNTGDDVVVLGNPEGGGTILSTPGKVLGFGPRQIEIDNPIYPGNSGSPILHGPTGHVIGVVSYARKSLQTDFVSEASRRDERSAVKSDVRYFGYRVGTVENWERIDWERFRKEGALLASFHRNSTAIHSFMFEDDRAFEQHPMLKRAFDEFVRRTAGSAPQVEKLRSANHLIRQLDNHAREGVSSLESQMNRFYDFHRARAREELHLRRKLQEAIARFRDDFRLLEQQILR